MPDEKLVKQTLYILTAVKPALHTYFVFSLNKRSLRQQIWCNRVFLLLSGAGKT